MKILKSAVNHLECFDQAITPSQYWARDFVLGLDKPLDDTGIKQDCIKHVHAIIIADFQADDNFAKNAMSLARQTALMCHFPNFNETTGANRTKITIIDTGVQNEDSLLITIEKLKNQTGNLMTYCHHNAYIFDNTNLKDYISGHDPQTYIDIEFDIIGLGESFITDCVNKIYNDNKNSITTLFYATYIDITGLCPEINLVGFDGFIPQSNNMIDVRRAKMINLTYQQSLILNSPKELTKLKTYKSIISDFCKKISTETDNAWDKTPVLHKLSSVICGDCFEMRMRSAENEINSNNFKDLAHTEHARWNVEKLILGYRPYTKEERQYDVILSGDERKNNRRELRNQKVHIDICSCCDLTTISPDDFKYDYFLMLAMEKIIKTTSKNRL